MNDIQFSKYHPASFYFGPQQLDIVINRIIRRDVTRQFMPNHGDGVKGRAKLMRCRRCQGPKCARLLFFDKYQIGIGKRTGQMPCT